METICEGKCQKCTCYGPCACSCCCNVHLCRQCEQDMGNEWILGPVCGKCCRANHKAVTRS